MVSSGRLCRVGMVVCRFFMLVLGSLLVLVVVGFSVICVSEWVVFFVVSSSVMLV